ncbi:MAG: (d)CMP kinase [Protaetiibacter sp.]
MTPDPVAPSAGRAAREAGVSRPPVVVAVDGPAGSGKSSVSRAASRELGYAYLDTGAAYRALTHLALERGVDTADAAAVASLLDDFAYDTVVTDTGTIVTLGGADVTSAIREPRVSAVVSDVARVPEVRRALNAAFRRMIRGSGAAGIVVEGRDITTVVAPDAAVRILLTADEAVRIARRTAELAPGAASTAEQLRERDARDSRVVDFLTAAPGVTTIDSTGLDFDQTVQAVVELVRERVHGTAIGTARDETSNRQDTT